MENINELLINGKRTKNRLGSCKDKHTKLDIEVCNFETPIKTQNKYFFGAVIVTYKASNKFYAVELYEKPISEQSMKEAVINITMNPSKYKNQ